MAVHAVPSRSLRRQAETAVFVNLELDGILRRDIRPGECQAASVPEVGGGSGSSAGATEAAGV